ncbi:MAG TPA: hypothetical protein VMM12_10990 [Longimicrobiales bacterium]|nr:hypothetical protein [Longimicrobiales bacterium]
MAIADLLWACPRCGLDRGLRASADGRTCARCATRYDRVRGARIRARSPDGAEQLRSAAEWVDALPDPATLLGAGDPIRTAAVTARFVARYDVVRESGRYVNRIEVFGAKSSGTLEMAGERLAYRGEGGDPVAWPFEDLRAVQASSRALQIRGAHHPLASFAFNADSSFLWERLLALALGDFYRRTGRGEIVELQPRIVTR